MKIRFALVLALLAAWLPAAWAAERTLVVLRPAAEPEAKLELTDADAPKLIDPARTAALWRLEPGERIEEAARPRERVIDLYTGTARALNLVARVFVRYYATPAGWVPHFRLEEQPAVVQVNGRWQPLQLPGGAGQLVRYGSTLPNPEGFFPVLEFGPAGGALPIAGWQVH